MSAMEVVGSYHGLWHVDAAFRMKKMDLRARPIFQRTSESIEAHLTVVSTALAVARFLQDIIAVWLKNVVTSLRPLREFTERVNGQAMTFVPEVSTEVAELLEALRKA